jgi:hypothetical protein
MQLLTDFYAGDYVKAHNLQVGDLLSLYRSVEGKYVWEPSFSRWIVHFLFTREYQVITWISWF